MPIEMNGVQAWITVDNKVQLAEYEVDLDLNSNTATCWISGEPGQASFFTSYFYIYIWEGRITLSPLFNPRALRQ